MIKRTTLLILTISLIPPFTAEACADSTWPTLHRDYQRSGWTGEIVRGPYERKWYRDFHDEMIATRVEAIIARGKCFVGTFAGNIYALDIKDGRTLWTFTADGPIGASPCCHNGRLYFGADEGFATGRLYCLNADDGSLIWKYDAGAGIWVSPACDGEKIYFGDRAGVFHALSAATGKPLWTFQTAGMILKPASFSLDNKRIVVGSEDMHVYCLAPSGRLLWKSKKLAGLSMRDQAPTIWQGLTIVRTNPADSFHTVLGRNGDLLKQTQLDIPKGLEDKVLLDKWNDLVMHPTARRRKAEQDRIIEYLRDNPHDRSFYTFDLKDGSEPWIAPVLYTCGLHNPPTPPTFNPKTGRLYTFCRSALTYYIRGVRRYNALAAIDRKTGRFNFHWPEETDTNWYPFAMIGDETQSLSMMGNLLISNHQGTLGGLDLDTRQVTTIWAGRDTYGGIFGSAAVPGSFDGAKKLARQGYLTGMPNEWHGPDRSICAVAEGRLFWVVGSHVVCIAGPDVPKASTGGLKPPPPVKSRLPRSVAGGNVAVGGVDTLDESIEKLEIKPADLERCLDPRPPRLSPAKTELAGAVRRRLDDEVLELVEKDPWAPFIVELGISGEERHFHRTAQTMQILSLALPHLSNPVRSKAIRFLDDMFEQGMPLDKPLHANNGKRREPYDLGPGMKAFAQSRTRYDANIEDLYALWAYAHYADRFSGVLARAGQIEKVFRRFADAGFRFDHAGLNDDAEHLNARIAGVLAAARIFAKAGRQQQARKAEKLLTRMLAERVHHERADTALIRPTKVASKGLHQAKVPRYLALTPEVAAILTKYAAEQLTRNVRALTRGLPLWYQAYSERMIGGENYISPPHLARGLFIASADAVGARPAALAARLDQPWCRADLYYIEKASAILRRLDIEFTGTKVISTQVVKVGPGGYLTAPPKPCKPLPEKIYKTAEITGPILTSQWWSSLIWQPHSQPMFPHPLLVRCTEKGLTVSCHGARITANKHGIFGSGHGPGDFTIGHSAAKAFPQAECGAFSDWFVTAVFAEGTAALRTSFGHGSPFVFGRITGGRPTLTFDRAPRIFSGDPGAPTLGVTVNGHHYGLFGPSDSAWIVNDTGAFVNNAESKDYFTIALLPDDKPQTLALFLRCAHNHVTDTRLDYRIEKGLLESTYRFDLTPLEGRDATTLFALYPHQWKYTATELTTMTYNSVRGLMKLGRGDRFATTVPIQGVLPMLPAGGIADRRRMIAYLKAEADKKHSGHADTYWEGKHLGRLATLSGVAEAAGAIDLRNTFVAEIKRRLEQWFTPAPQKEQPVFYYDANWGTLVGSRPSYGSDLPLNDHHFHYGYFIRAAAEVARIDLAWAEKWRPMVELLIRDIASIDRRDPMFPYLRCFDKYAGHSWASGDANFGDGNNQESSSESLNAWYGMILWGQFTGNRAIRDAGIFLFNTERTAVEEYWFDVSATNYPKEFPHVALGMIWCGKGAFATWFSGEIDCIHGINWLPFTPASLYMGRHPAYVKKNHDRIISVRKGGTDYNTGWGDLVCMFNALQDPAASAAYIDAHPSCKLEAGNTHAFMYHWIHTLNNLGLNDTAVTADHPLTAVFNKAGRKTYAAYNSDPEPRTVTFSDGAAILAKPRTLTLK